MVAKTPTTPTETAEAPRVKRAYNRRTPAAPTTTTAEEKPRTRRPTAITVTGYESEVKFYATRYKQGGRMVYALDLSLAQIASLLPAPDPDRPEPGNRRINLAHAQDFAHYIRTHEDWVSPALVLRGPSAFEFQTIESIEGAEFGVIAIPRLSVGDLRILDGQHRILGIHLAIRNVSADLDRARSQLARARKNDESGPVIEHFQDEIDKLTLQRKRFESERTSIQIFVEDEQRAYQQMFYDIADKALGITASVKARFDTRNIVNRVLVDVMLHPLLAGRVDMEKDRLGRLSENFLSAKNVVDVVRILAVGLDGRMTKRAESEMHENTLTTRTNDFLDALLHSFHQLQEVQSGEVAPSELRQHSMLGSPVTIRALAGVYYELRRRGMSGTSIAEYFTMLDPHLSAEASEPLLGELPETVLAAGSLSPSSRRQDLTAFRDRLVELADDQPEWLTAA